MGMTIAEHIAQLKKLKSFHNGSYGTSINFVIETMRKYQKIQEIINYTDYIQEDVIRYKMICEVIEDEAESEDVEAVKDQLPLCEDVIHGDFMGVMDEEYGKMKAFCLWIAEIVTDEEAWKDSEAIAEIACRKLHKLGIIDKQGDSWVYKE